MRISLLLLVYFIYGMYLANVDLKTVPEIRTRESALFYDYRGAINVRSKYSDGAAEPMRIVEAAQDAGLDYLFLSDWGQSGAPDYQGYFERLLVTTGAEYRSLDMRLLVFGAPKLEGDQTNWMLTDWLSQQNPTEREPIVVLSMPYNTQGENTWGAEWPKGINALEVQNPKVMADRAGRYSVMSVIWSLLVYPFNPQYAFLRLYEEPQPELELWDRLNQQQKVVGLSGVDASARAIPFPGVYTEFPSYQTSFELMSTHLVLRDELVGSFEHDLKLLHQAIRQGNAYFALDLLGNPKGFISYLQSGSQKFLMGETAKLRSGQKIHFDLPATPRDFFEIVLIRNGQREKISNSAQDSFSIDRPGAYRLIVRVSPFFPLPDARKWVTWIYTNPFYIEE